ncbi:MAG TPA: hypothetical protein VK780_01505, partial [Thermoanaerobaculia bacterium]|nr:hypothetical protein [Thermoanaerobaculia bacterium]
MRLQRTVSVWAVALLVLCASVRPVSAAASPSGGDPLFEWKQGWVESPQWGGRLGYIDRQGDLKVRLRSAAAGSWVTVARHVRSFQLLDWSLAVLGGDGRLLIAEGALEAPLDPVSENVCAFQKTLTRLGILQCDGTLLVKESPGSQPRAVATGIEAFQILDDRVALRGADGSLWVQEGGVAANFHKLADRVSSFQLERGWIAYLEPPAANGGKAAAARLMIAEGSLFLGSAVTPREVARDVMDFEMEVRVDADASFQKTLYLAVLSREGVLKIGVGASLPAELKEFDRGPFCSLGWAGGRLAYLGAAGLKVAHFGAGGWPESLDSLPGTISSFRMTPEGTLLFDGVQGSSNLVDWRPATEDSVPAAQTGEDGKSTSLVMDASAELAADAASGDAPAAVESSSVRPHFMRRPVQAELSPTASRVVPVRLFSNVPPARAVDASGPPVSSDAAGALKTAPDASTATTAAFVRPLSQATAVPLYQLYYSGTTDHFYTTSASDRDFAKSLGFLDQGVAAYVEPTQIAGTLPFWRFYSSAQTDHFYTTSVAEYNYVVANGFSYESVEGYLYSAPAAGTVPLHRLSWWNPSNNDLDHFYTTSDAAKNAVLAQGWTYD